MAYVPRQYVTFPTDIHIIALTNRSQKFSLYMTIILIVFQIAQLGVGFFGLLNTKKLAAIEDDEVKSVDEISRHADSRARE
jgi:hypothetical protein